MKGHVRASLTVLFGIAFAAAVAGPTHAQGTFTGSWTTTTANPGWIYDMTLTQSGATVTGNYTVTTAGDQQNTKGTITGTASGGTLKFTWAQEYRDKGKIISNAFTGTGQFTLCADG